MGEKFRRYRHALTSLTEYVLVAETRCEVGQYLARSQDQWPLTTYTSLDDVLFLSRMPCRVTLRDIYKGVLVCTSTEGEPTLKEEMPWQWYR
jgi:hypothetical protein